jgi:hypothetical protein
MAARLNMDPIRPILWKGKTFNQIVSGLRMNHPIVTSSKSIFNALPMKHYRREISSTAKNSRPSYSVEEILRPGGSIIHTKASNAASLPGLVEFGLTENKTERPTSITCSIRADEALKRVRSAGNVRRPDKKTVITSAAQYLVNRRLTFDQSQYHHLKSGNATANAGEPASLKNVYMPNGACNDPTKCVEAYYKPSNSKFATQGGVSSGARLERLKYDNVQKVAASYTTPFGKAVANALYLGSGYTIKDKIGTSVGCIPNVDKYKRIMKKCGSSYIRGG